MKSSTIVASAVALAVGGALGFVLKPSAPEPAAKESGEVAAPKAQIASVDDASVKALRARVKELEKMLAEKQGAGEKTEERRGGPAAGEGAARWPNGEELRANIEKWKKENPEEYARLDKMRQDFMQRRAERTKSRLDFLASVDTSRMSKEDRETHTRLQELIAKRENLEKRMNESLLDMSNEDRGEFFREMGETSREINELNEKERGVLFKGLANELGIQGEEANAVSETVQGILDATRNDGFGGMRGMGGMRGPGGGRGGRR